MTALPRLGKGVLDDVPRHVSETCDGVLVVVVVQSAVANSGFATPGSTPMLSNGGSVSEQNSPSHCGNALMTGCSKFVRGLPLCDRGLEGEELDYSWWEWLDGVGSFVGWVIASGLGPSEWL